MFTIEIPYTVAAMSQIGERHQAHPSALASNGDDVKQPESFPGIATQALSHDADLARPTILSKRVSSTETVKYVGPHPTKVHFAASPHPDVISEPPEHQAPHFLNPFFEQLEAQSRRASTSSQCSDIVFPEAFAGHRDTLTRLVDDADDDEEQDAYVYAPTQAGFSLLWRQHYPLR